MEFVFMIGVLVNYAAAFLIGYKWGRLSDREPAPVKPVDEPVEAVQEIPEQPEDKQSRFEAIMRNIDRYNGTEEGQEDVPWR